ncbi:DUF3299 domain-containing protein [Pseudohalioglobus sediminis]|uniref:DUF3299 domain-containing protein n=2 Tax=Pseudohalioglobus sediminis TaxID=2606449 RepID=A0A5B0WZZ9_9GAMM|nr:DUF3299 domain-containing protein [Pseudohalioglobus sediminis]
MSSPLVDLLARATVVTLLLAASSAVQPATPVSWQMLMDTEAQVYEDPYRDLTQPQMLKLMTLARIQQSLISGEMTAEEEENLQQRAAAIAEDLRSEGLDANWILAQRAVVAARRRHAALATNSELEGHQVEITGYLLNATSLDTGESVTYLVPSRGVCMHLPAPPPNQVVLLVIEKMPDPIGPCIAAALRGRLSVEEAQHTIPSADGSTPMWSRWKMDVSEVTTTGNLPAQTPTVDSEHR